jgi:hypothetical protein
MVKKEPRRQPYFFRASTAYAEHVGKNLQVGGLSGDNHFW